MKKDDDFFKRKGWRKLFTPEYERADIDCEDVWRRHDNFVLSKFPDSKMTKGKWCLFSPLDDFLGRCESKSAPTEWADKLIKKGMNSR